MNADVVLNQKGGIILNTDNDPERRLVESCYRTRNTMVNPIIDWTDDDVWDFLHHYGCESNPLYKCGRKRIGCLFCPMSTKRERLKDEKEYPKYKAAYIRAFDKMLENRKAKGLPIKGWRNGEDVFEWWIERTPGKMTLNEFLPDGVTDEPDADYLE